MKEDNTVFVVQQAIKAAKIKVSDTTIKNLLLSHPHYPSLKSVCDALKKCGIEHYPLKLEISEIKELRVPFIGHLNTLGGQLIIVEEMEIKNNKIKYRIQEGKKQVADFNDFSQKLSGVVLVLTSNTKTRDDNYKQNKQNEVLNKALLPFAVFAIFLFAAYNLLINPETTSILVESPFWILLVTKILGIIASLFLLMHEFKIHTPFADKICGFSSKTDCDAVLSSSASGLFGWINWADAGIIYFSGTLIFILGMSQVASLGILALISALSLPYPLFSIYYQAVRLKKWCPFCLIIQVILICEFFVLLSAYQTISFTVTDIMRLATSFLMPAAVWLLFKAYYNTSDELDLEHYLSFQFKRNPVIFKVLLEENGYSDFSNTGNSLILGNKNASITITAFLSLYCNPCAGAFKKLKALLDNCPAVKVNAVFSVYDDDETHKVINLLYYLQREKDKSFAISFLDKWYSMPKQSRKTLYNNEVIPEQHKIAAQIKDENKKLFEKYDIAGTPTLFVNGYKFPIQYEYSTIEFFIDEITRLTEEKKRQEAYSNTK